MTQYAEGNITFDFPDHWHVTKYDDWAFYRNQFMKSCDGNKGVDFLAYDPQDRTLWLIEVKDYRQNPRTKSEPLWKEIATKVRDTLAGLFVARIETYHDNYQYAVLCSRSTRLCVVLHLEQPPHPNRLFQQQFKLVDVHQKLKQMLKPIDHHPRVVDFQHMNNIPWDAQ
ncbi:MAG: hypothetical protein OHK0022_58810 [Roseiflexaceae bacterium]